MKKIVVIIPNINGIVTPILNAMLDGVPRVLYQYSDIEDSKKKKTPIPEGDVYCLPWIKDHEKIQQILALKKKTIIKSIDDLAIKKLRKLIKTGKIIPAVHVLKVIKEESALLSA